MGCNSSKQQDVARERERAAAPEKGRQAAAVAAARAPPSAASPIRPVAGGRDRPRERDEGGAYELGKTPSDQHQREQDSFQVRGSASFSFARSRAGEDRS